MKIFGTQFHNNSFIDEVTGNQPTLNNMGLVKVSNCYVLKSNRIDSETLNYKNVLTGRNRFTISAYFRMRRLNQQKYFFVLGYDSGPGSAQGAGLYYDKDGINMVWYMQTAPNVMRTYGFSIPMQNDVWYHYCVTYENGTTKGYLNGNYMSTVLYPINESVYDTGTDMSISTRLRAGINWSMYGEIKKINIYDHALSLSEIQNEYQYFLNLKSPSKPVYFSYKPKPNKLTDGLVANYTKCVGQTMIDNINGHNLTRSIYNPGFVNNDGTRLIKLSKYCMMLNATGINLGKNHSIFIRLRNGGSFNIESLIHNYLGYYIMNTTSGYFQISTAFSPSQDLTICFIITGQIINTYVNGILDYTRTFPDISVPYTTYCSTIYSNNSYSHIKDISFYNVAKTEDDVRAYHKQFEQVTLHEDFSNYAVGQSYGDNCNASRPKVFELTSPEFGYPKGKKYIGVGLCHIPTSYAYGTWEFHLYRGGYSEGQYDISIIDNNINAWNYGSYRLGITMGRGIAFVRNNEVGLFGTPSIIIDNTDFWIKIVREFNGRFSVYIKGDRYAQDYILLSALTGSNPVIDNTYTTSTTMLLSLVGTCKLFEITHTSI